MRWRSGTTGIRCAERTTAQLTIIACTGADDDALRRVIDAGFDHAFRKPTKIQALLDVVASCGART